MHGRPGRSHQWLEAPTPKWRRGPPPRARGLEPSSGLPLPPESGAVPVGRLRALQGAARTDVDTSPPPSGGIAT